jgi:hypothetical protein
LIGAAMMFSSTIIGLKLLPTTALHHRHVGEIIISVLLLQDIIAILILLLLEGLRRDVLDLTDTLLLIVSLPALAGFAFVFERYVLVRVIQRFDTIQEYVFLVAVGWCLGVAQLGHTMGLSYEMGAFIAGVALATSPIATFIAESLKPLRDFFLIMFFFALGAGFATGVQGTARLGGRAATPWPGDRRTPRPGERVLAAHRVACRQRRCHWRASLLSDPGNDTADLHLFLLSGHVPLPDAYCRKRKPEAGLGRDCRDMALAWKWAPNYHYSSSTIVLSARVPHILSWI